MEGRIENLVWTIAQDYDFSVDFNIFNSNMTSKYKASILGFFYQVYNMELINSFLNKIARTKNNYIDLLFIAEITMENAILPLILEKRPGIFDYKKSYETKLLYKYNKRNPKNLKEELEKSYYEYINNVPIKINHSLEKLLMEIINFKSTDTDSLLIFLNTIYKKYFHINISIGEAEEVKKIIEKAKVEKKTFSNKKIKTKISKNIDDIDLEKFTIESAEFTSSDYEDLKVVMEKSKTSSSKFGDLYDKVRRHYGELTVKIKDIKKLEDSICTGIHSGINLYFTKGEYKHKDSTYFEKEAITAYENNLKAFEENKLLYKRGIKNLEKIIKNSLLKNTEDYEIESYSGNLVASKVWQSVYGINNKIFNKTIKSNQGNISVDIVLDQSASQKTRQSNVAIEGYIISEALTNLNIKTRVIGFNNFYNYMIIRQFRDYNDSILKNKDIFKYNASGSNRDGLIIKLISHLVEKNEEERKLIIILSDGKPNDEINIGLVGAKKLEAQDYLDDDAILDSFNQVLVSRLKGIHVLGVFMGDASDLEAEKKIFGKNFAYITDIKRFHHIVGIFFKSVAKELYE